MKHLIASATVAIASVASPLVAHADPCQPQRAAPIYVPQDDDAQSPVTYAPTDYVAPTDAQTSAVQPSYAQPTPVSYVQPGASAVYVRRPAARVVIQRPYVVHGRAVAYQNNRFDRGGWNHRARRGGR